MSWVDCKRLSQGVSEQRELYSLYPPPHGRTFEQEESRYLKCEKTQTDCNVEHEGLDSDPLVTFAYPCLAVEKVQKGFIAARIAAIGHDDRCPLSVSNTGSHMNEDTVVSADA